jgi:integrase
MNPTLTQVSPARKELRLGSLSVAILKIKNGPYTNFSVRWKLGRKSKRISFSSEEKSMLEADRILRELANNKAPSRHPHDDALIEYCLKQIGGIANFPEAVRCWQQVHGVVQSSKTLAEISDEFVAECERRELSKRYTETVISQTNVWKKWFGDRQFAGLRTSDLDRAFEESTYSPVSKNNLLSQFAMLENYSKRKGYIPKDRDSVAKAVPIPRIRLKTYPVFTPEELTRLFLVLRKDELAYVATMAFGGSRRAEFERLTQSEIDLKEGTARITAEAAKKGVSRALRWPPNLRDWMLIAELPKEGTLISRRKTADISGDKERLASVGLVWRSNVLRHSFCSYHLMKFMAPPTTAYLGGTSTQMLDRHYSSLVTARDAEKWFNITPESVRGYAVEKGLHRLISW